MKNGIILHWPLCNADYLGVYPRAAVLDTNIVLDLLVFNDPQAAPIKQLFLEKQLRWITDAAQRLELERVLSYSQIAPRLSAYGKTAQDVLLTFEEAAEIVPMALKIRFTCSDADDQHFLDLAAQYQALLISKDKAVLKHRKHLAQHFGAIVGSSLVEDMILMPG